MISHTLALSSKRDRQGGGAAHSTTAAAELPIVVAAASRGGRLPAPSGARLLLGRPQPPRRAARAVNWEPKHCAVAEPVGASARLGPLGRRPGSGGCSANTHAFSQDADPYTGRTSPLKGGQHANPTHVSRKHDCCSRNRPFPPAPTRRAAAARAAPSAPRPAPCVRRSRRPGASPVVYGLLLTFRGDGYG